MAFVIVDAEALLDDALEIEAPPAHDAVDLSVGASCPSLMVTSYLCRAV
jgi:hypothetical protein